MKRKNILSVIISVIIIAAMLITAAAVTRYKFTQASGEKVTKIANRVNIEVSATEFQFDDVDEDGLLVCCATVSIKKTEPDFYGVLNSITMSGCDFEYIIYTAGKDNSSSALPQDLTLPTDGVETYALEWEITFAIPYEDGKTNYEASIDFNYTTGVKTNTAQRYLTSIPVYITIN